MMSALSKLLGRNKGKQGKGNENKKTKKTRIPVPSPKRESRFSVDGDTITSGSSDTCSILSFEDKLDAANPNASGKKKDQFEANNYGKSTRPTRLNMPDLKPLVNPGRLNSLNVCKNPGANRSNKDDDSIMLENVLDTDWHTPEVLFSVIGDEPNVRIEKHAKEESINLDFSQGAGDEAGIFAEESVDDFDEVSNEISFVGEVADDRTGRLVPVSSRCNGTSSVCQKKKEDPILASQLGFGNRRNNKIKGNLEELKVAESLNDRPAIYRYTFRIQETKENMKVFTEPDDRRIESLARASSSQIRLEPVPIRTNNTIKMRKVTIESPDLHCLEKCCKLFDDKFPHFYVTGNLGLGSRAISRTYLDEDNAISEISCNFH